MISFPFGNLMVFSVLENRTGFGLNEAETERLTTSIEKVLKTT